MNKNYLKLRNKKITTCRKILNRTDFKGHKRNQDKNYHLDILNELIGLKGGKLCTKFERVSFKVVIECENGHKWNTTLNNLKTGSWCPICKKKEREIKFKKLIQSNGGILLSEYKNSRTKVMIKCCFDHQWVTIPSKIKNGHWCPVCKNQLKQ